METEAKIAEALKLMAQFGGALIVARLTVYWALSRFKEEKSWEREVAAVADIVTALAEMKRITGKWIDEQISAREYSPEDRTELEAIYGAARRRYESAASLGALLLPKDLVELLSKLEKDLSAKTYDNWFDNVNDRWGILDEAIRKLVESGRSIARRKA